MKILLYTFSEDYNRELGIDLIPFGIESIECNFEKQVFDILKFNSDINILTTENYNINFLEEVRKLKQEMNFFLIIPNSFKPNELIKLTKFGIKSILNYNDNTYQMAEEIIKTILRYNLKTNERRMHMRVKINSYEKITASVFLKDLRKFIRGLLIDISAGGFLLKLYDSLESSLLVPNKPYDPVIITIGPFEIKTVSTLVYKKDDMAGFRFDNIEYKERRIIASYIHRKIQENIKELLSKSQISQTI